MSQRSRDITIRSASLGTHEHTAELHGLQEALHCGLILGLQPTLDHLDLVRVRAHSVFTVDVPEPVYLRLAKEALFPPQSDVVFSAPLQDLFQPDVMLLPFPVDSPVILDLDNTVYTTEDLPQSLVALRRGRGNPLNESFKPI